VGAVILPTRTAAVERTPPYIADHNPNEPAARFEVALTYDDPQAPGREEGIGGSYLLLHMRRARFYPIDLSEKIYGGETSH
jgi:hypothetical protein